MKVFVCKNCHAKFFAWEIIGRRCPLCVDTGDFEEEEGEWEE